MNFWQRGAALSALAALLSAQAAQAADAIYLGSCDRAKIVQQQSTIDLLVPHARYEGIQRIHLNSTWKTECDSDELTVLTLTQKSRSTNSIVFDTHRTSINFGKKAGCLEPARMDWVITGTATFTTRLEQKGELCELLIWSDWIQTTASDPGWQGNFANRVISMDGGGLVISQPGSANGEYRTPVAYTAVSK
jgi:hypothetical protein